MFNFMLRVHNSGVIDNSTSGNTNSYSGTPSAVVGGTLDEYGTGLIIGFLYGVLFCVITVLLIWGVKKFIKFLASPPKENHNKEGK